MDVKSKQENDPTLVELKRIIFKKAIEDLSLAGDGVLPFQGRLYALDIYVLRKQILSEAHNP